MSQNKSPVDQNEIFQLTDSSKMVEPSQATREQDESGMLLSGTLDERQSNQVYNLPIGEGIALPKGTIVQVDTEPSLNPEEVDENEIISSTISRLLIKLTKTNQATREISTT